MLLASLEIHSLLWWVPTCLLLMVLPLGAYCYFLLTVEIRLLSRRTVLRADFDSRCSELVAEIEALRARLGAAEVRPAEHDWTAKSLNLNQRGQILRLHGKGLSAAEIASDLKISQGEVELLVKVHDWPRSPAL